MALRTGASLLLLQPSDRFSAIEKGWADAIGVHYAFVVGRRGERSYTFSSKEILATIDLLNQTTSL
jgi:hypothetical protein